jgi:hypothetical protein
VNDRLGPSRIGEVLDPVILVGTLIATLGAAGLGLSYDRDRATTAIVIVSYVLLIPSLILVAPYFISIGRQGIEPGFPLLGVGAAATGCAGLVVLVGLAVSRPLPLLVGGLALAAGLVAIGIDLGARRRPST